ncbi:hypothetical protein EYF80_033672 [Liparis tanakae]|uniref:Uncharacterized protein n=1 Tax=Liparis tanakae TaxID=230148 RepID=A0A4Z2GTQ9_9TELE|nr:hypothetical protein EYF80_033672 [Liparis tanakae]
MNVPSPSSLTQAFGQQIANKFIVVSHVQHAVHARGHQLALRVAEVTRHVLRNEDDAALPVDDEEEPVEGLNEDEEEEEDTKTQIRQCAWSRSYLSSGGGEDISMGPSASFSTSPWLLEEMSLFCTSSSGDRRAFSVTGKQTQNNLQITDVHNNYRRTQSGLTARKQAAIVTVSGAAAAHETLIFPD